MTAERATDYILQRYPVFHTTSAEELVERGRAAFGALTIVPQRREFEAKASLVQLPRTAMAFATIDAGVEIVGPDYDFLRLQICLRGQGETIVGGKATPLSPTHACIAPARAFRERVGAEGQDRLTLRIASRVLADKLETLLGRTVATAPDFTAGLDLDRAPARSLAAMAVFFGRQLDTPGAVPTLVLAELEQAIAVAMLTSAPHSLSHLLAVDCPAATRREVHLAEAFIEANWHRPLQIEDLSAVSGVSARTLFKAFREVRGTTPMAFLKMVRLRRARELLASGDPACSVTAVAFRCGFGNPGHFARYYREVFGELPSQTLAPPRRAQAFGAILRGAPPAADHAAGRNRLSSDSWRD
jgi:AraC-like DNA-binding protein